MSLSGKSIGMMKGVIYGSSESYMARHGQDSHDIKVGKKGGKYYLRNGKKVYISKNKTTRA